MSPPILSAGLRCRDVRRTLARRRRSRRFGRRLLWLAPLAVLLLGGALGGARWLLTADRFAVQRIETGPYRFTDPAALDACLRRAHGGNIWTAASARRLDAELASLAWVRRARVSRELPGTLRVELEEWRPLLRVQPDSNVAAEAGVLVMRGDGRLEAFPAHLPPPQLPVLAGARFVQGPAGDWQVAPGLADSVLALILAVGETGLEGVVPVDFVLADATGLSLVLQGAQGRLLVGGEDYAGRLRRFLAVGSRVAAGSTIDLRFGRRVFVDGRPAVEDETEASEGAAAGARRGRPATDTARAAPARGSDRSGRPARA